MIKGRCLKTYVYKDLKHLLRSAAFKYSLYKLDFSVDYSLSLFRKKTVITPVNNRKVSLAYFFPFLILKSARINEINVTSIR